jgi:hypothetical protein
MISRGALSHQAAEPRIPASAEHILVSDPPIVVRVQPRLPAEATEMASHNLIDKALQESPTSADGSEGQGFDATRRSLARVLAARKPYLKRPAFIAEPVKALAGMSATRSVRSVVSKSMRRIRLTNRCSRNHSLTHPKAASSSFTVIIIVVCSTNHSHAWSGIARSQTPKPPMTMSSNPPEANWFWPVKILFSSSNVFAFLTGVRAGVAKVKLNQPGNQRQGYV